MSEEQTIDLGVIDNIFIKVLLYFFGKEKEIDLNGTKLKGYEFRGILYVTEIGGIVSTLNEIADYLLQMKTCLIDSHGIPSRNYEVTDPEVLEEIQQIDKWVSFLRKQVSKK